MSFWSPNISIRLASLAPTSEAEATGEASTESVDRGTWSAGIPKRDEITVASGVSFWRIAEGTLTDAWDRTPTTIETANYSKQLIDANRDRLLPPHDPNLIHTVLDNLSAHTAPEVTDWLDHPKRVRWHLHFTPTNSSCLNLIERWFKELTDRRLRRGVFTSIDDPSEEAIAIWTEHWNDDPQPFIWHKTAEEIIKKVRRGRATLHQIKSATDQ